MSHDLLETNPDVEYKQFWCHWIAENISNSPVFFLHGQKYDKLEAIGLKSMEITNKQYKIKLIRLTPLTKATGRELYQIALVMIPARHFYLTR